MRDLKTNEIELLARIEKKESLRPYFFRKASGVHWFNALLAAGYFSPEQNPHPKENKEKNLINFPTWAAVEYLRNISSEFPLPENKEIAEQVLAIIINATEFAKEKGLTNYRTWWMFSEILPSIPIELIERDDLWIIDYWLDDPYETDLVSVELGSKWLPNLLEVNTDHSKGLALSLLSRIFKVSFVVRSEGEYESKDVNLIIGDYWAKDIIKKNANEIGHKLGADAVEVFRSTLSLVLQETGSDKWSSIWRPSIADHQQNTRRSDRGVIINALRDVLDSYVKVAKKESCEVVRSLIDDEFETIRRLAIYVIDNNFEFLKEYWPSFVTPDHFSANFQNEMWNFLHNHYGELDEDGRKAVLDIIQAVNVERDEEVHEGASAYRRSIWLSAVKKYGEHEKGLYDDCVKITGEEPDHPQFSSFTSTGRFKKESPIPVEKMLEMPIEELIGALEKYEDNSAFNEPGIEGLAEAVLRITKAEPDKIAASLDGFLKVDQAFIYNIIKAYRELWKDKAKLDWAKIVPALLQFVQKLIDDPNFWAEENSQSRTSFVANRHWIVGAIAEFVEDGTRADEHAFDAETIVSSRSILLSLLSKQEGEPFKEDSDAVHLAINSPRGKCIEALINQCLRECRLADSLHGQHDDVWKTFAPIFESELERAEHGEYEFATLVANYIANFSYMSRDWVSSHLGDIFDTADTVKLRYAMQGFSYLTTFHDYLYFFMKENDIQMITLEDDKQRKGVKEKVVQFVSFAFISEKEEYNESLIKQLVERGSETELTTMIWFIGNIKDEATFDIRSKAFELWDRILKAIDIESKDGKIIASALCGWSTFIERFDDENLRLLEAVAPYASENHNSYHLMRWLVDISATQPLEAHKIWGKLVSRTIDYYHQEHVEALFANLLKAGDEGARRARDMANFFLEHGHVGPYDSYSKIKNGGGA
ncbi:hypothetical protein [Pseudodesulfovibrio sp. zrk46]|uniref:hypothetical protein n=1 Tax=Pseudodesulfovibrio sp. zrk46 TaxID=2725288 RepID=UPI001449C5F6|nr:hypothetical protein [Pseudodesulfovibrio sp. zrk46]QJB57472.1 hypothetical protein HFN16_14115 [Pseudodesulfovibrio sp. zrk46]